MVHSGLPAFLRPVAVRESDYSDTGILPYGLRKAVMAFKGRRRARKSSYLDHVSLATELAGKKMAYHLADLEVVGANEGGIFRRIGLPVEEYDRNTGVIDLVDLIGEQVELVRRHDQQIYPGLRKTVYLTLLQLAVIIGRNKAQSDTLVEICRHLQLLLQLLPPGVLRALGDADDAIRGGLAGSTVLDAKAPMMMDHNFKPGFRIELHIKDLNNAINAAHATSTSLPLTASVMEMMQALKNDGCGKEDHSALVRYYEKISAVSVEKKN